MNDNMKISANGLDFISKWEGCILKPYKDIAGLWTIGVGHLILPHENFPMGVEITKERALQILSVDIEKCEVGIKKGIKVPLTQNQFDALCSFGFNCGVGVYTNSGVARELNAGNYDKVPERLLDWSKATISGKLQVVQGLYNRRKSEGQLFERPDNQTPVVSASPVVVPWDKNGLTDAQTKLAKLGLYKIKIDGIWGPSTLKAVQEFATQCGITVSDPAKGVPSTLLTELSNRAK